MSDFATRASRLVPPFCLDISHKSSRLAPRALQILFISPSYLKVRASRLAPYLNRVNKKKSSRFASRTFPHLMTFLPKVRASHLPTITDIHTKSSRLALRTLRLQNR